jgi:hypothetical protein
MLYLSKMSSEEYAIKWLKLAFNNNWETFYNWFKENSNWEDVKDALTVIKNDEMITVKWLLEVYGIKYLINEKKWDPKSIDDLKPYTTELLLDEMEFTSPFEYYDMLLVTIIYKTWSKIV